MNYFLIVVLSAAATFFFQNTTKSLEGAGVQLFSPDRQSTLLVQGKKSKRWGWTKGHREHVDASWLDTAIREVKEESGFELEKDYWLCSSTPTQWGKRLYWQGITFADKPTPVHNENEHTSIGWFSNNELASLKLGRDVEEWRMFSNTATCDFDSKENQIPQVADG